jgi:hypothetical protein
MINPIPASSLFVTPDSLVHLDEMIRRLPSKDQALVYQYTMFTFNLANKLVTDANPLISLEEQSC